MVFKYDYKFFDIPLFRRWKWISLPLKTGWTSWLAFCMRTWLKWRWRLRPGHKRHGGFRLVLAWIVCSLGHPVIEDTQAAHVGKAWWGRWKVSPQQQVPPTILQSQSSPPMIAVLADIFIANSWKTPKPECSWISDPKELWDIINAYCCVKPLHFRVTCHTAIY